LIASYAPGLSLPREFYTSEALHQIEMHQVFATNWLLAGHTCELAQPGDYITVEIGDESVILIRDSDNHIYAHYNVCRHRGSRIVLDECGNTRALTCPYHQWVYRPNGQLIGARLMGEGFCKSHFRLHPVHVRELAGLLFVCLADEPPDFRPAYHAIAPQLLPHGLDRAKVICRHEYTVQANWKTIIENNRECYHCRVSHPEFIMSNYDLGLPGDQREDAKFDGLLAHSYRQWEARGLCPREYSFPDGQWFRVARYPLREGFLTESLDGHLTAPLMGDLPDANVGSLRLIGVPNFWAHANADYTMTTRISPLSATQTRIDVAFLVRADAVEGEDYDPQRVAAVWQATSEQDWELCENNYAGIRSAAYTPGPLSPLTENSVQGFYNWYLGQLQANQQVWRSAA
jgi:Rieske 2Fe-2S family protein